MKINLTKYRDSNSLNYLNREYKLNIYTNNTNWLGSCKLRNLTSNVYYKFVTHNVAGSLNIDVTFSLYSDAAMTTKLAEGYYPTIQMSGTIYGTTYNWFKLNIIPTSGNTLMGYLIMNLVYIGTNPNTTHTGYMESRQVIDWICEEKLLTDYVNGLDEQYINGYTLEYTCSDFDIRMSNLTGTESYLGYTPFEFLQELGEDEFIRCVITDNNNTVVRSGTIDNKSFEYNYNTGNENNTVTFKVFDLNSDFATANTGTILIESITSGSDFATTNAGDNFFAFMSKIVNALGSNLSQQVNFDLYYWNQTASTIILNTAFLNQNKDQNLYEWFKEICKCGGMLFKVQLQNFTLNGHNETDLVLFYPNESNTTVTISKVIEETQGDKGFQYDKLLAIFSYGGTAEWYYLFIQDFTDMEVKYLFYKVEDNYYRFQSGEKYDSGEMKEIELPRYAWSTGGVILYQIASACFIDSTNNWLPSAWLFKNRYRYLLNNYADTLEIKINFTDVFEVDLYNKFLYKGLWWYVEKISDIDLINKTMKIQATELL